ncbi:MAG: alpha-mannosidase, partial [Actinomycetota bacterium]
MHVDRELIEKRIDRELWERVLPVVDADRRQASIRAGDEPASLRPFTVGTAWGAPWTTAWFELSADVPDEWRAAVAERTDRRIEMVCDLGFTLDPPGFQAEGTVRDPTTHAPIHGIHPRRTHHVVADLGETPSPTAHVLIEAASNPTLPQFAPSPMGDPATAGDAPLFVFRRADLVLVDVEAEALVHDLDVLAGAMRALPLDDPHRHRLRAAVVASLDAMPDVATARQRLRSLLTPSGAPPRHRMIAIGHAHIDTAWLWPTQETVRKCIRTFSSAVELMDADPAYRFGCSQAQQYVWVAERHPELFASIVERARRGQWIPLGGMWVEADMNLPSGESLARQIVFGQRWFEAHLGRRCTEMWIPDVFGYPAGLPQLFAAGGMQRFVTQKLSWNKQNRFPHHTFWWEGLDGTRVLTHFPPVDTYNAEITPGEIAHANRRFREHEWSSVSLLPFGHGDGGGGPTREMLERAHRLAGPLAGGVLDATVDLATPADFFEAVEAEATAGAPVPVWRGELYFETHRGTLTSQLKTKLGNRRCERLLVELERWSATAGRSADADDLWREVLTQQFHDILPGSSIAWVHRDAEAVFERVGAEVECRITETLTELAPAAWTLANPADVALDGIVVLDDVDGLGDHLCTAPTQELDGGLGVQRLADGAIAIPAVIPAGGFAPAGGTAPDRVTGGVTDRMADRVTEGVSGDVSRVTATDTSLHNGLVSARLTATGELSSLIDVATARDCVPAGRTAGVVSLAPDHPVEYDAWDLESWTRDSATVIAGTAPRRID